MYLFVLFCVALYEVLKLLLDAGCDSMVVESTSFTPMHIAALTGNEEAIQELSSFGLSTKDKDNAGMTPEQVAQVWGRHNTAWLLHKMAPTSLRNPTVPPVSLLVWCGIYGLYCNDDTDGNGPVEDVSDNKNK